MSGYVPKRKTPLWLLCLISISGTLAMHMFVPALPAAAHEFSVGSGPMQMAVTLYILGLAFGQLLYGPLSDSLGRRPVLLGGLTLYVAASVAAATAASLNTLLAARLVQALGGCAGLALGRAIVRDTSSAEDAVAAMALLTLAMMVAPGFSPLIGASLAQGHGWRSIFWALTVLALVTLVLSWRLLPETATPSGSFHPRNLVRDYRRLLGNVHFLAYAVGGGCVTTSIYAYIATAPFIMMGQLHRPAHEVGLDLGLVVVGMSLGNVLARNLIRSRSMDSLLMTGSWLCLGSAMALLVAVVSDALNAPVVVGLMFVFALGAGLSSPAALTKALGVDTSLIGSAAGMYGFIQMAVGALCTFAVGFGSNPALSVALVLSLATAIACGAFALALRKQAGIIQSRND